MTDKKTVHMDRLLKAILKAEPDEIDCDECAELIDQFVELNLKQVAIPEELLKVRAHLEWCHCCQEVQEALEAALQAIQENGA
jgi:hypothetical protein